MTKSIVVWRLQPSSSVLFACRWARASIPIHGTIVTDADLIGTWHEYFPRFLCLLFNVLTQDLMALPPDEGDQDDADQQRSAEQDDIDGDGVVLEHLVGCGVESRLGEVEQAGETDDQAVDFAEGGEAEDFG